jgi:hypothetical protein
MTATRPKYQLSLRLLLSAVLLILTLTCMPRSAQSQVPSKGGLLGYPFIEVPLFYDEGYPYELLDGSWVIQSITTPPIIIATNFQPNGWDVKFVGPTTWNLLLIPIEEIYVDVSPPQGVTSGTYQLFFCHWWGGLFGYDGYFTLGAD